LLDPAKEKRVRNGRERLSFLYIGPQPMQHHAPQAIALVEIPFLMGPTGMREGEVYTPVGRLSELEACRRADGIARPRNASPFDLIVILRGHLPREGRSAWIFQRPLRAYTAATLDFCHRPALQPFDGGQGVADLGVVGRNINCMT